MRGDRVTLGGNGKASVGSSDFSKTVQAAWVEHLIPGGLTSQPGLVPTLFVPCSVCGVDELSRCSNVPFSHHSVPVVKDDHYYNTSL